MFSNNLTNDFLSIIFCANWSDSLGLSSRNCLLLVWVRGRSCFNSTGLGYGLHRSWIDECKPVERAWKRKVLSHLSHRFSRKMNYHDYRRNFFQVGVKADEVKVGTKTRILTDHWPKIPSCIFTCTISTQKQAYRNPATK